MSRRIPKKSIRYVLREMPGLIRRRIKHSWFLLSFILFSWFMFGRVFSQKVSEVLRWFACCTYIRVRHQNAAFRLAVFGERVHVGFREVEVTGSQFEFGILQAPREQILGGQTVVMDAQLSHLNQREDPRVGH